MRKKKTKSQQEHDKQLRRLKSIVRRAEKAGLIFDTSPIPEKATTKRLSKITGADIRKQGYRLTPEGKKDYYTPFKERQRGVQKAKETIAKKREQPSYNYMYIAQREYASKVAQKSRKASPPNDRQIQTARLHYEFAKERHQDKLRHIQQYVEEVHQGKVNPEVFTPAFLEEAADAYIEGKNGDYYDYDDDYFGTEQSNDYDLLVDYSPEPFNPKDSKYFFASSTDNLGSHLRDAYLDEFEEGIRKKLTDSDYEQFHNVVFDVETGEPVARYDPIADEYSPFSYRRNELYGIDRDTGEVQTLVDMFSYQILDKIDVGIYTIEGEYVLDEHSEPIATFEVIKRGRELPDLIFEPYEAPTFKDIADYNLDDYLSGFSPNMEAQLRDMYEDVIENGNYFDVQENLQEAHYAYERVIHYTTYTELLEGYYEMARVLKRAKFGDKTVELTADEMEELEKAVNDDRVKRTRRKKKRTKKK